MKQSIMFVCCVSKLTCVKSQLRQFSVKSYEFQKALNLIQNGKDNSFKIQFDNEWSVGDALNGGYLMAVALKAARNCAPTGLQPLSFTGYYMNKGLENTEAEVDVSKIGESKSTTTLQVTIKQLGLLRTQYIGVFGELKPTHQPNSLTHNTLKAPHLPSLENCIDGIAMLRAIAGMGLTLGNRMSLRLSADSPYATGFLQKKQIDVAAMDGWVAFEDGCEPDLVSLSLFSDSYPPCVLNLTQFGWVPTLQYGVHFWAQPQVDKKVGFFEGKHWLRARFSVSYVKHSMLFTDGELWSADGQTLLATSRQLARVFTPRG